MHQRRRRRRGKHGLARAGVAHERKKRFYARLGNVFSCGGVSLFLDYHTQFSIENYIDRFTPMLDCDVLVIDDLGKENAATGWLCPPV